MALIMSFETKVLLFVVISIICSILFVVYRDKGRVKEKRSRLVDREPLSFDEIFSRFFADRKLDKMDALEHWTIIAELLGFDPERMRPGDRFDYEMGPVPGKELCDEIEGVWEHFHYLADERSIDLNAHNIQTLEELITLFSRRTDLD